MYYIGDSLTVGQGSTSGHVYPDVVQLELGPRYESIRLGFPGRRASWFVDTKLDSVAAVLENSKKKVVLLWFGANDIANIGAVPKYPTVEAYEHTTRGLAKSLRIGNTKVVIVSVLNRKDSVPNQHMDADRLAANKYFQQHWSEFADGYVDLAKEHQLFASNAPDNSALFTDKVHLLDRGYKQVGLRWVGGQRLLGRFLSRTEPLGIDIQGAGGGQHGATFAD